MVSGRLDPTRPANELPHDWLIVRDPALYFGYPSGVSSRPPQQLWQILLSSPLYKNDPVHMNIAREIQVSVTWIM